MTLFSDVIALDGNLSVIWTEDCRYSCPLNIPVGIRTQEVKHICWLKVGMKNPSHKR